MVMAPYRSLGPWLDVRKLGDAHAADYERRIDNLIRGLVDLLPKPDGIWPLDDRAKWLRLAAGIFDLGYKADDGEHREISIATTNCQPAKELVVAAARAVSP